MEERVWLSMDRMSTSNGHSWADLSVFPKFLVYLRVEAHELLAES